MRKINIAIENIVPSEVKNVDTVDNVEPLPLTDSPVEVIYDEDLLATNEEPLEGESEVEFVQQETNDLEMSLEELQEDITVELAENDKVLDIAENLDDIANIVESSPNEELSTTEKQLMLASANMAVSGSDDDASAIAPSMEAMASKKATIEQMRMKHKVATEGIIDSIQTVVTKLVEFTKGLFSFATKMEYRLRDTKKKLAVLKMSEQKQISIKFRKSTYLKKNITEYVADLPEYITTLKSTVDFYGKFAPLAVNSISAFKGSIIRYWTTLPGSEETFSAASGLYKSYINDFIEKVVKLPGVKEENTMLPHVKSYRSEPMLGGSFVVANKYHKVAEAREDNVVEMKNTISNSILLFARWIEPISSRNESSSNSIMFTADVKQLEEIIVEVEKAIKIFKLFLNGAYKSFSDSSILRGPKIEWNGKLMSLHRLIINRGTNNALIYLDYIKQYSKVLASAPLDVVDRFTSSTKWDVKV